MGKKAIQRGINSFVYTVAINVVIYTILIVLSKRPDFVPILPGYSAHFSSNTEALMVQLILIGFTSGVFGAGSVIMELERISLLAQSILYFIITAIVWVPISCLCWEINKYPQSFISVTISYVISYVISWVVQYITCKKSIEQINQKLAEMKEDAREWR